MMNVYSLHLRLGLPDGLPVERSNLIYLLPEWCVATHDQELQAILGANYMELWKEENAEENVP